MIPFKAAEKPNDPVQDITNEKLPRFSARELDSISLSRGNSQRTRNDAANRLLNLDPPGLSAQLLRMLQDPNESPLWRNTCVQFLKACYEKVPDPEVLNALETSVAAPEPEIASCALLSLAQTSSHARLRRAAEAAL